MSRQNPNANAGLTNSQKWSLEAKAKQGWKCFFMERDSVFGLQETRENSRATAEALRNGRAVDLTHLTQMFLELYTKVGELIDCPICYETMTKDNTELPHCGHMVCKTCKPKLTECPICRKKY